MSSCECPGCPKAVIQGGPPLDDQQGEAMGYLAMLMERTDFTCFKPTEYKIACSEVGGYMCTVRVDATITNIVTQLVSTRGGTVDMCMWPECAHCYNRLPWEKYSGCGESLSSLHYMANDNQHVLNALIEMFGNEQMSEAAITNLEYRCTMKPFVDYGAIVGSSSGSMVLLFGFFMTAIFVIKRKIRDEHRAVLLLGKTEEEKNKLLDEWGIGYQAKRNKEIKKAMKKHQKEEEKKALELKKAEKRAAKRRVLLEKRIAKVNAKHDKKTFSIGFGSAREKRAEKKRKKQRQKRLSDLGCTQEEIDHCEMQEIPELAALELETAAVQKIEASFGNIEENAVRSDDFLGAGGGIFGEEQSAGFHSKFGEENGIEMQAMKQLEDGEETKSDGDEEKTGLLSTTKSKEKKGEEDVVSSDVSSDIPNDSD